MASIKAYWLIELNCTCPNCDQYVDLLDYTDFWYGRKLDLCENNTDRSRDVEVVCPHCYHEFKVDCQY